MCNIDGIQNCCCIIRVYVADEFCFHFEFVIYFCPVLKCKIHCTRTKVTSADTDLDNSCEFLACSVCDLTSMYFVRKFCDLFLLFCIESSLVNAVSFYCVSKLSTCHMMKNKTFLSCVDHFSIVKSFEFLCKLCFLSQFLKSFQHFVVYLFCCKVISKSLCHRNAVILYTLCAVLSCHNFCKVYFLYSFEFLKRSKCIQIVPGNHN